MDESLFKKLYVDERKSYKEIGELVGLSKASIYRWVKKLTLTRERRQVEDLSEKEYGSYKVLSYVRSGRYADGGVYDLWLCRCKCGAEVTVRSGNLKQNTATQCKQCGNKSTQAKLTKCPIDYNVWFRIKDRCRIKGLELGVTPDYLYQIYEQQEGLCALSGVPITFGETRSKETTASPDRIDPKKGYIEGNIRWVHKYVNSMRNSKPTEEFIEWCRNIVQHSDA